MLDPMRVHCAHRRAHRPRQPPPADRRPRRALAARPRPTRRCSRSSTSTASSATTTPSATRPATRCSRGSAARSSERRRARTAGLPARRRRVLRAARRAGDERGQLLDAAASPRSASAATASTSRARYGAVFAPGRGRRRDATRCTLADQRLYAQKRDAALAAAAQPHDVLLQALHEREPDLRDHSTTSPRSPRRSARGSASSAEELDELAPRRRAARRRQDGDPGRDPRQARPARRRRVGVHAPAHDHRRAHPRAPPRRCSRSRRSCARATSAGTAAATPTASPATTIPLGARIVAVCDAYYAMTLDAALPAAGRARAGARGAAPLRRHAVRPGRGRRVLRRGDRRAEAARRARRVALP